MLERSRIEVEVDAPIEEFGDSDVARTIDATTHRLLY